MNHIVELRSQNVKRLKAVRITPLGNMIVLGGRNAQGKSSVLDSILYALGGAPEGTAIVRRGEDKAVVEVDLGDLRVRRVVTKSGTTLSITNADGIQQRSPQALLDAMVGRLTFDPLEFSRQKPREQAETLRRVVGIDFTELDKRRQKAFDERTQVNRTLHALEAMVQANPKLDAPAEEISLAEIVAEQQKAAEVNRQNDLSRRAAQVARQSANQAAAAETALRIEMEQLAKRLEQASARAEELRRQAVGLEEAAAKLADIDLAPFRSRATEAEAINAKVAKNRDRAALVDRLKQTRAQSDGLSEVISLCDSERRDAINHAKWPIEGLDFETSGGVTLNGLPLDNASDAEKLRVSVAIGLALNPKLKVLLVRDGSLLDADSLAAVRDMAEKAGAQVWIERVGRDEATSVVIEDGEIKEEA